MNKPRLLVWFLASALIAVAAPSTATRPNIILVMADDQGWGDTSYNGHPELKTPQLDTLAKSGLRFDRFYTAHFNCSPTRGSVMTGRHPNRYGTFNPGAPIRAQELTVARVLQSAGYATGHFGKWHLNGKNGDRNTTEIPGRAILASDPLSPGRMNGSPPTTSSTSTRCSVATVCRKNSVVTARISRPTRP